MSRGQIANYEQGQREPDFNTLQRFADFFEVTMDYLIKGNRPVPDSVLDAGTFYPVGEVRQIPIVAEIPCGTPVVTEDNIIGYFPVDTSMTNLNGGEYVWLKAKGDSMIGADIRDGSLVFIRLQPEVEDRDIAAVCIDGETATLKRIFITGDNVILMPENSSLAPYTYEKSRIRIVGKAIKVINDL